MGVPLKKFIIPKQARAKITDNSWNLLDTAVNLFHRKQFNMACFTAMTSIEEAGKAYILYIANLDVEKLFADILGGTIIELDTKVLIKRIKDHLSKATDIVANAFTANFEAEQRHGIHSTSKMYLTHGLILLTRSGKWMTIRNACLYTDFELSSTSVTTPKDTITREHAYYLICMTYEILAQQARSGSGSLAIKEHEAMKAFNEKLMAQLLTAVSSSTPNQEISKAIIENYPEYFSLQVNRATSKDIDFYHKCISNLDKFMTRYSGSVNLNQLDLLANPEPLVREAKKRESNRKK